MPSSISNSEFQRPIPELPWRGLLLGVLGVVAVATAGWELYARSQGYRPTLNDTADLWSDRREAVKPDSIVVIGDSRALFDTDLGTLEKEFGQRPVQLALVGSCAFPVFENLANDESFHGTVIASLVPMMWLAPPPSPPFENSQRALKRYRDRTVSQRASHHLAMMLEEHVAFLKNDDLTLSQLLSRVSVPNRASFHPPPKLPPYFATLERDRSMKMIEAAAKPGPLQERIRQGWLPLFTPPPPPSFIPPDAFAKFMAEAIEARFAGTVAAVKKIQSRGGRVVFVRYPVSGPVKEIEDRVTPRPGPWTRFLAETGAPGIYFEDYPELASFELPEWSHLSGPDSVTFTQRLAPYLKQALATPAPSITPAASR